MKNKNMLSDKERELQELAEKYEAACAEGRSIYMDADELADVADWYASENRFGQAFEAIGYGLRLHPDNVELLVEQAYLYIDTHKLREAKRVAERIPDQYSPAATVLKANILLREGALDAAEKLLDTLEDPDDLGNIVDVAYMYLDKGYTKKAWEWIQRGEKSYADDESYLAVCADYRYTTEDFEEAARLYNLLIDQNPYASRAWYGLAQCHVRMEEFSKAIDACDYALVCNDEYGEAYFLRGYAYQYLANPEKALENYRMAVRHNALSPSFADAYEGVCLSDAGEWGKAIPLLERSFEDDRLDEEMQMSACLALATCYIRSQQWEKARQTIRKTAEKDPEDPLLHISLGGLYLSMNARTEAIVCFGQAINLAPLASTWAEIGLACLEYGEEILAREALEEAQKLEPDTENFNEQMATAYLVLRDKKNFLKYNDRSNKPFSRELLNQLENAFDKADDREWIDYIRNIINPI